jgi:hypothetical protein
MTRTRIDTNIPKIERTSSTFLTVLLEKQEPQADKEEQRPNHHLSKRTSARTNKRLAMEMPSLGIIDAPNQSMTDRYLSTRRCPCLTLGPLGIWNGRLIDEVDAEEV